MKKLINTVEGIVEDMITGYVAAYSDIVDRLPGRSVVVRRHRKDSGKVGLVIGNGSGHEPIAMGWVGSGMLDANALGPVFTAPPPSLILQALRGADQGAGGILLISHHAGDLMNAEMAVELARAEDMRVEPLVMYDEIYIGMGVHGEAGMGRGKMGQASEIVSVMADALVADLPFQAGDEVLAFVNGSGGTTLMELLISYGALARYLEGKGIRAIRPLVGEYVTTQESQGMSISLCRTDAEMRRLWLAPAVVPFFADRGRA